MGLSSNSYDGKNYTESVRISNMDTAFHPSYRVSSSIRWSISAGLYMFVCGTTMAFLLDDLLSILADVIGVPTEYSMAILASPALVIGTVAWWTVIERRDSYTYLLGGIFGLVTALLTGVLWTARFVRFWGFEMLTVDGVSLLVVLVLGLAIVTGFLTGLPLMYARRHLDGGRSASCSG